MLKWEIVVEIDVYYGLFKCEVHNSNNSFYKSFIKSNMLNSLFV